MTYRRFSELRDDLYARSPGSRERVEAIKAQVLVKGLAELRRSRGFNQTLVAEVMGTTQSGVARIERQDDLLLSTLRKYVAALGGELRIVVDFLDGEVVLASAEVNR